MAKNKKKTSKKRRHTFFYLFLVIVSGVLIWTGIQELKTTFDLHISIRETEEKNKELKKEKKELEAKKKNLSDPDYIEYIARGKYLVTKEGEQVFKFPSTEE
ncbi:MAG: septum formation initiator family protein [Erysipelotrichaceae bacterium]|nr:septum formation initiator family protein [Erysipelotrichaceae bacterium]